MTRIIIEFLLALLIGFVPFGKSENPSANAPVSAEPVAVTAEVTSQQEDGVKAARFENMLEHNFVFGTEFAASELIESVAVCLKSADKSAVDSFVFNMYGKDITEQPAEETYEIAPRGYDKYEHTVKEFFYNGDGTVTVITEMCVNPDTAAELYDCVSVFLANGESVFGYNLLSCEVDW